MNDPPQAQLNPTHSLGIAVVIPCHNVRRHILGVVSAIGAEVDRIFIVDDCCPESSGQFVTENCNDARVRVIHNRTNQGVGGAVMEGYRAALAEGYEVIVKVDGDGQMDPALIPDFVNPILENAADYTKGNRFHDLGVMREMPKLRLFGNACLSLMNKISSGYWNIFDPTNGYTAIHASVLGRIPFDKVSRRYFFESDMLYQLNIIRAVVIDIPMRARYGDEKSGLRIQSIVGEFLVNHVRNLFKRIFYNYYLRDMSVASLELPIGTALFAFGAIYGANRWCESWATGVPAPAGSVMLAAMPVIIGLQFLLAFVAYDISSVPSRIIQKRRKRPVRAREPEESR